jgi:hypothetical protein
MSKKAIEQAEFAHPPISTRKLRRAAWRGMRKQQERFGVRDDSREQKTERWRDTWKGSVDAAKEATTERNVALAAAAAKEDE